MARYTSAVVAQRHADSDRLARRAYKRAHRVGGWILIAITALLALLFFSFVLAREVGWSAWVMLSGSMGDAAPAGSLVIGDSVEPDQIKIGDMVMTQPANDGPPVMHRVITVQAETSGETGESGVQVTTRGDANNYDDEPMVVTEATARGRWAVPGLGRFMLSLRDFQIWRIVIPIIVGLAVLFLFWPVIFGRVRRRHTVEKITART